jgi:hypothetical protein
MTAVFLRISTLPKVSPPASRVHGHGATRLQSAQVHTGLAIRRMRDRKHVRSWSKKHNKRLLSALRLDVEVEQPRAFAGEFVNARRGRATEDAASVDAQLAIAEIVSEDEDDVRLFLLRRLGLCELSRHY